MTPAVGPVLSRGSEAPRFNLRPDWYRVVVDRSTDLDEAGIYQWSIADHAVYVGKAKVLRTRLPDYAMNVRGMIEGRSWHGDPNRNYRLIHHELRKAYETATPVVVSILETCGASVRAERERWWIDLRRREEAEGGPRVLNATRRKIVALNVDIPPAIDRS